MAVPLFIPCVPTSRSDVQRQGIKAYSVVVDFLNSPKYMKFSYSPYFVKRSSSVKVEVRTVLTSNSPPNGFSVLNLTRNGNNIQSRVGVVGSRVGVVLSMFKESGQEVTAYLGNQLHMPLL
jgi:hypothetical protein